MRSRLIRLPLVVALSAGMAWFGLFLMFLGSPWFPALDELMTVWVVGASILIWSGLGIALGRRELKTWLVWGLVSPLLGCMIVYPPASFAFVLVKGYIAFPVGLAMGAMMWWGMGMRTPGPDDGLKQFSTPSGNS